MSGLAYVSQSFGALYRLQGDFLNAEQYYHRALKLRESLGNTRDITSAMVLLGMLYSDVQRFDDAFHFFKKADSTSRATKDSLAQGEVKILIGEYYLIRGMSKKQDVCRPRD
ncbi:MAG: tetratricopeptide repeat protein [Bacteroidota bacterium]